MSHGSRSLWRGQNPAAYYLIVRACASKADPSPLLKFNRVELLNWLYRFDDYFVSLHLVAPRRTHVCSLLRCNLDCLRPRARPFNRFNSRIASYPPFFPHFTLLALTILCPSNIISSCVSRVDALSASASAYEVSLPSLLLSSTSSTEGNDPTILCQAVLQRDPVMTNSPFVPAEEDKAFYRKRSAMSRATRATAQGRIEETFEKSNK